MFDGSFTVAKVGVPLLGGALIGLAASLLYATTGRIAGVSGIASGLIGGQKGDRAWRLAFLLGLTIAGTASLGPCVADHTASHAPIAATWLAVPAGLLVGFGARLGSGCTSGHGVCGVSRLSPRSMVATMTFIATGAITVQLLRLLGVRP